MRRAFSRGQTVALWLGLLPALTSLGCAQLGHHRQHCCPPDEGKIQYPLPETERGALSPDLRKVGSLADVTAILGTRSGHAYKGLTPRQCQCMAIEASTLGNLLEADRRSVIAAASKKHKGPTRADMLEADILAVAALEARNRSAADALDLYYRIAEAETQQDLLVVSLREMNSAVDKLGRMRRQGLQITFDDSELFRERNNLRQKQVDLEGALARLNIELRRQLGFMVEDDTWRIWPLTDLAVTVERLDSEEAVAIGMQLRPEVGMLIHLQSAQDLETIDVTRQALSSLFEMPGTSQSKCCELLEQFKQKIAVRRNSDELWQRQQQLNEYARDRIQHISAEIRQAVVTIESRLKQIALAKEHAAYAAEQVRILEGRNSAGKSNFLEVTLAKLQHLQAKSDIVSRVVSWKVAHVRLREHQGKLLDECCGFSAEGELYYFPEETVPSADMIQGEPVAPPAVQQNQPKELPAPPPAVKGAVLKKASRVPAIPKEPPAEKPQLLGQNQPKELPAPPPAVKGTVLKKAPRAPAIPKESPAAEPQHLPTVENSVSFSLPESFEPRSVGNKETGGNLEARKTNGQR